MRWSEEVGELPTAWYDQVSYPLPARAFHEVAIALRFSLPECAATGAGSTEMIARRRAAGLALGAGSIIAALLAGNRLLHDLGVWASGQPEGRRTELLRLLGEARLSPGRLIGFSSGQGEFQPATVAQANEGLRQAAYDVRRDLLRRAAPQTLWNSAIVGLAFGKWSEATARLEEAAGLAPRDARLWSDLAAAYLASGVAREDTWIFVRALDAAEKAIELDGSLPAARFNRALALERLYLTRSAAAAWRSCLEDADPAWAAEINTRLRVAGAAAGSMPAERQQHEVLAAVTREGEASTLKAVKRYPQAARELAQEMLLPAWAEAAARREPFLAGKKLSQARTIGRALAKITGDQMVNRAVAEVDAALARGDTRQLDRLSQGHRDLAAGYRLYKDYRIAQAASALAAASKALSQSSSAFAFWADFYHALCSYQDARYDAAMGELDGLRRRLATLPFPSLLASVLSAMASTETVRAADSSSLALGDAALSLFDRIEERGNAAAVHEMLAEDFLHLGDPDAAWRHLYLSLVDSGQVANPRLLERIYLSIAGAAADYPRAALHFENEALRVAAGEPVKELGPLRLRAASYQRLGRLVQALADLRRAKALCSRISEPALKANIEADLYLLEGELALATQPEHAAASLAKALERYRASDYNFGIVQVYLDAARSQEAAGDLDAAERDLRSGIAEAERERRRIAGGPLRVSFADRLDGIFDEMVAFQLEHRRDVARAFAYAERARASDLLDLASAHAVAEAGPERAPAPAQPLTISTLAHSLPGGYGLVELSVLPDRVVSWVVAEGRSHCFQERIAMERLSLLAERFRATMAAGDPEQARSVGAQLFALLLGPLGDQLRDLSGLIIVPDKDLGDLPFAALVDPRTGKYLIEELDVVTAPSARLYLWSQRWRADAREPLEPSVLVVGNPSFRPYLLPELAPLQGAEEEAERVAALYTGAIRLSGERATKQRFLNLAGGSNIVQFSGHAQLNLQDPMLSRLVLAPGEHDDGLLYAHEICRQRLTRTRLVVLSACSTAHGPISRSEGVLSLTRSFLAAGVPAVIGTLWRIPDRGREDFSLELHRRLQQGIASSQALRQVQLAFLASGDHELRSPATWAAFQHVGAGH